MFRCLVLMASCVWTALSVSQTKLLIVTFDGFRHDYVNKTSTPHIINLRHKSTHADYMRNVFPTKSAPSQHSLATGVYVEEHGVIDSQVHDHGANVTYSQRLFEYNPSILPIWIQNQKHGGVSGSMMWLGGEFKFQETVAKFHQELKDLPWERKIATVISWLNDSTTPANLVMLYFNQPDFAGHHHGASSIQVQNQVNLIDSTILPHLNQKLKESKLDVNVFIISDHGMADVPFSNIIDLSVAANQQLQEVSHFYTAIEKTPFLQVIPVKGKVAEVYEAFSKIAKTKGHFKVYVKSELPPRWRLRNNARVPEILVAADLGYGFHDLLKMNPKNDSEKIVGAHGYDNNNPEMYPIFMAWGPNIKKNFKIPPFDSVDLYVLWCKLLGIPPGKHNGVLANVVGMLKGDHNFI